VLERLARFVISHHRLVVGGWILLIAFGVFSTSRVGSRWLEQFSIPGYSAYEANQGVLKRFGNGAQAPNVAVFHSDRDVTGATSLKSALARFERRHPAMQAPGDVGRASLSVVRCWSALPGWRWWSC
jgi:uncharacterized membrane protein YdfJ with MMPL/SSD domain